METKDTNPKDAIGSKKVPLSTLSAPVLLELGIAMLEGSIKYRRHNYRVAGVRSSVYYDAAMRHLMAWWEGEDIDPESGISHVVKAMACCCIIRDSQRRDMLKDDRPPKSEDGWVSELNKVAEGLLDKFETHLPPYTENDLYDDEVPSDEVPTLITKESALLPTFVIRNSERLESMNNLTAKLAATQLADAVQRERNGRSHGQ